LENANAHVRHADEVAVVGPMHSGCAAIEVPVTNRAPTGPLVMVSNAATKPGLTKAEDPGEPGMYYPTGKRSFARTVAPDDVQAAADARLARDLGIRRVYVLHDSWTYGQGMARFFAAHARRNGITVIADSGWDPEASSYTDLFQTIKASRPDAVYFAGVSWNNGAQLIRDKVAVLGDNTDVKVLAPDGFTGDPAFDRLPQAQGMS
jgi:branched-chain amino acid transport system substrate-binding protein